MKVLAFDTATLMASVAVVEVQSPPSAGDGRSDLRVLASRESNVDTHSDNLLPLIDAVLDAAAIALADIDGIAVGAGPGSFTGLRIGMATAKGLAFAAAKPLWAISSLAALAADWADVGKPCGDLLVPVLDARRREVFAGFFRIDNGRVRAAAAERVLPPADLAEVVADLVRETGETDLAVSVFGDGITAYPDVLQAVGALRPEARTTPSAVSVARLALSADESVDVLESGAPVYIRPSEAEVKFPRGNPGGTFSSCR